MSAKEILPLDLPRLDARLRFHDYQPRSRSGELLLDFEASTFTFRVLGGDQPWLTTRTDLDQSFGEERYPLLVALASVLNQEHFLVKVYPVQSGQRWTLRAKVALDATAGLSDEQLDEYLSLALSALLAVKASAAPLLS